MVPILRKADAFRIALKADPTQAHRGAAGALIDYRLQEVTDSAARAICTVPDNFADKPKFGSPWHYHDCDMQIGVVLDGSVELGYRAHAYARAEKSDVLFIPGHTMHDVSAPSTDYRLAEITFPGTFGTTEAPMPAEGADTPAVTLGSRDAIRAGAANGMVEYRYPVSAPHSEKYAITRFVRSRTEPFVAVARKNEDRYRFLVPFLGSADLADGAKLEVGDLLVVPKGAEYTLTAASDDWAYVEVTLRG